MKQRPAENMTVAVAKRGRNYFSSKVKNLIFLIIFNTVATQYHATASQWS